MQLYNHLALGYHGGFIYIVVSYKKQLSNIMIVVYYYRLIVHQLLFLLLRAPRHDFHARQIQQRPR